MIDPTPSLHLPLPGSEVDIYSEAGAFELLDDDELDSSEQGFMAGYMMEV